MGRCGPEDSFSHLSSFARVPFQATELKSQSQAPLKKMGDLSFKCIKISQNFSSHALKFDRSSSQDPLFRGNFQFASRTLRKSRLDNLGNLNTCWVPPPPHTHKKKQQQQQQHLLCRNDTYPLRHDLKDSEYSNLKEKPGNIHYNWIEQWYYPLIIFFSLNNGRLLGMPRQEEVKRLYSNDLL